MSLLLLIPLIWLLLLTVVVAICQMAARGDAFPVQSAAPTLRSIRPLGAGRVTWEECSGMPAPRSGLRGLSQASGRRRGHLAHGTH